MGEISILRGLRKMAAAALLVVLAGCASRGSEMSPSVTQPIPDGQARIVVYRPYANAGLLLGNGIYVGNTNVAYLAVNEMTVIPVAPGQHVIKASLRTLFGYSEVLVDAEAGKTYLVESGTAGLTMLQGYRAMYHDGSFLTDVVHGKGTAQGGNRLTNFEASKEMEELRGYRFVPPSPPGPFVGLPSTGAASWRR